MTFKHILIGSIIATSLSACSDFLTQEPMTALPEEKVMSNLEYAELALQSTYTRWRDNCFKDQRVWELLIATDEIQSGALQALKSGAERAAMETFDASLNSQNYYTSENWTCRWPVVGEAAKIIAALRNDELDNTENTVHRRIFGEACFVRGSLYYQLAMLFGRLPLIDPSLTDEAGYRRQSLEDTWAFLIEDLKNASFFLPETNSPGRASRYAALMMLGKAYMSAPVETGLRDFQLAYDCFEEIVRSGYFSLNNNYADLWDYTKGNTPEAIFEWQFNTASPDNNGIQFQIGSRAASNYFGDQCYFTGYDHALPTEYASSFKDDGGLWDEGDSRFEESFRTDFTWSNGVTPTLDGLEWEALGEDHDELDPHIKKYEDYRTDLYSGLGINNMWNCGKNIPWLRYADCLLLYAECMNELGRTADALNLINTTVRARAFNWQLPADKELKASDKESCLNEILDERMRELNAEMWRRFDLVRTGKYAELVKKRNKWATRYADIKPYNIYWPIPLSEIEQNEDIGTEDQNEGYK